MENKNLKFKEMWMETLTKGYQIESGNNRYFMVRLDSKKHPISGDDLIGMIDQKVHFLYSVLGDEGTYSELGRVTEIKVSSFISGEKVARVTYLPSFTS